MSGVIAYEYNIIIYEGGTFDKWFRWLVDGVPVSLTGFTGKMQVRQKITDSAPLLSLLPVQVAWQPDATSGIYMMDVGVDDRYRIYIKDEDTLGLCVNHKNINGTYNLFLYNPSGESVLKQYGSASIVAAVTR